MAHVTDVHPRSYHVRQTAAQIVNRLLNLVQNVARLRGRVSWPNKIALRVGGGRASDYNALTITNGAAIAVTSFLNRSCANRLFFQTHKTHTPFPLYQDLRSYVCVGKFA